MSVEGAVCVAWFSFDWQFSLWPQWDGRRFYADVDAGGFDFAEFGDMFTRLPTLARFRDGIQWASTGAGICGLRRYIRAGCLWGITTEGVERCWGSAQCVCL